MFKKQYDFLKNAKLYYIISAAIVAVTILVTAFLGLKIDIEFKGGSIATYSYEGEISLSDVEAEVKTATGFSASARISESAATNQKNVVVSIAEELSSDQQSKMTDALETKFKDN